MLLGSLRLLVGATGAAGYLPPITPGGPTSPKSNPPNLSWECRLIAVLDTEDLARAIDRLEKGHEAPRATRNQMRRRAMSNRLPLIGLAVMLIGRLSKAHDSEERDPAPASTGEHGLMARDPFETGFLAVCARSHAAGPAPQRQLELTQQALYSLARRHMPAYLVYVVERGKPARKKFAVDYPFGKAID